MEYATLNNGVKMPMAGIGTFLLTPDEAEASCVSALQNGYRLIDTANAYCNEKAVGRAMKKSGLQREEIFLETKLWPTFYTDADAVDKTLARLDTDYIDLLLIHQPAGDYVAGYRLMEKAYKEGKVRAIGLSNFNEEQIKEILSICEVKPTILQTEVHPYAQQKELKAFAKTKILAPGESEVVRLVVGLSELASFDEQASCWAVESGRYLAIWGSSSRDCRLKQSFTLRQAVTGEEVHRVLLPVRQLEELY